MPRLHRLLTTLFSAGIFIHWVAQPLTPVGNAAAGATRPSTESVIGTGALNPYLIAGFRPDLLGLMRPERLAQESLHERYAVPDLAQELIDIARRYRTMTVPFLVAFVVGRIGLLESSDQLASSLRTALDQTLEKGDEPWVFRLVDGLKKERFQKLVGSATMLTQTVVYPEKTLQLILLGPSERALPALVRRLNFGTRRTVTFELSMLYNDKVPRPPTLSIYPDRALAPIQERWDRLGPIASVRYPSAPNRRSS